jgi:hypothetical protein
VDALEQSFPFGVKEKGNMAVKQLAYEQDARQSLRKGVEKLASAGATP